MFTMHRFGLRISQGDLLPGYRALLTGPCLQGLFTAPVLQRLFYRLSHFVAAPGRFAKGPIRTVQVGRESMKARP